MVCVFPLPGKRSYFSELAVHAETAKALAAARDELQAARSEADAAALAAAALTTKLVADQTTWATQRATLEATAVPTPSPVCVCRFLLFVARVCFPFHCVCICVGIGLCVVNVSFFSGLCVAF
jgi:hypothetical protein